MQHNFRSIRNPRAALALLVLAGLLALPATAASRPAALSSTPPAAPPELRSVLGSGVLRVSTRNPRYFEDGAGRIVLLSGAHTWMNLQDIDLVQPVRYRFPYDRFLTSLSSQGLNFFRLWAWEEIITDNTSYADFYHNPLLYQTAASGPGGLPKVDLNAFNPAYFTRLRERVIAAGQQGIYVSVMLFNGWSVENKDNEHNPWPGHPYNKANNINGVNGDWDGNNTGNELHTLGGQNAAINALQLAYVHKVIDTLNDLDNVLYEISNESNPGSLAWQYWMIEQIKTYEAGKPKQHPVGMTAIYPGGSNADLFASPADWISVNGDWTNPLVGDGSKVIVNDTDHLCGTCGDRSFAWKSVLNGLNPILMDAYGWDGVEPAYSDTQPAWLEIRRNLGWSVSFGNHFDLATARPRPELSSSGYALASPDGPNAMYLVYVPSNLGGKLTVDLRGTSGVLRVEWLDPATGTRIAGWKVQGGAQRALTSPFSQTHDAVAYLYHATQVFLPRTVR